MKTYQTDDASLALRRIGKGVCPKSFPLSSQSLYFLNLYGITHGGDYGNDLTHLPVSGGALEQPAIFYTASDIISSVRARHFSEKMEEDKKKSEISTDDRKL